MVHAYCVSIQETQAGEADQFESNLGNVLRPIVRGKKRREREA